MRFPILISGPWAPVLAVFGMSREKSFVEIDRTAGTMRVCAGIWFDETFALRDVADVQPSTWPWYGGLGVKLGPGDAVSVVGAARGLVLVQFRRPQTMHVLVAVHRTGLRLSLEDPEGFSRALRESLARNGHSVGTSSSN